MTAAREPSGLQIRAQSKHPDDPIFQAFARPVGWLERRLADEAVAVFAKWSWQAERRRTGRALHAGVLKSKDLTVYRYLLGLAQSCRGQVFPTVERIAAEGMCVATAFEAKARLQAIGLIEWLHRAETIEDSGPGRPPKRQISNFYRVQALPEAVLRVVGPKLRNAYLQAVAVSRKAVAAAQRKRRADDAAKAARASRPPLHPDAARMLREGLSGEAPSKAARRDSS